MEHQRDNVLSIDAVRRELDDPEARGWAKANAAFFETGDVSRLSEVSNWVYAQSRFGPEECMKFLDKADPRLIAHALARGYTVVTHEVSAATSKKVKIPDVCQGLGVACVGTFVVLKELQARFILEKAP